MFQSKVIEKYAQRNSVRLTTIKGILKRRGIDDLEIQEGDQHPKKEIVEDEIPEPSIFSKGSSRILKTERNMQIRLNTPIEKAEGNLNRVWRNQPLNIIYYITRFVRQLKTNASKIKFKLLNLRILELINDQGSDAQNLLRMRDHQFQKKPRNKLCNFRAIVRRLPVIEPDSNYKLIWDIVVLIALIINIFYIPLELCFNFDNESEFTLYLNTVPSYFFVMDIFVTFQTAYYSKGIIHRNQIDIFKNYAKGKLLIDLLVVVPLMLSNLNYQFLKFSLLIRVFRVPQMIEGIEEVLNPKQNAATLLQLFKLIYFIIIMCHFCACIWVFLGLIQEDNSWMIHYGVDTSQWTTQYIYALYYSTITTLTIGYGDITPQTDLERMYAIVLALLVCGVLGYSVSTVGGIIKQLQENNHIFKQKMSIITRFLKTRNLNQQLQLQVRKYFEYYLKMESESQGEAEDYMKHLPKELKENVAIGLYSDILKQARIFENTCPQCIGKLCQYLHEVKIAPEQVIWNQGDQSNKLIFLLKGQVEVLSDQVPLKTIKKGALGEREFVVQSTYVSTLKAKKFSQIAYITYNDFIDIIKEHQEDMERYYMLRDNLLFNDNYSNFGQVCEICGWTHQMIKCPFVFIRINKSKIVANQKGKYQESHFFQRNNFRYASMSNLAEIQESALAFIFKKHFLSPQELTEELLQQFGFPMLEEQEEDSFMLNNSLRSEDIDSEEQSEKRLDGGKRQNLIRQPTKRSKKRQTSMSIQMKLFSVHKSQFNPQGDPQSFSKQDSLQQQISHPSPSLKRLTNALWKQETYQKQASNPNQGGVISSSAERDTIKDFKELEMLNEFKSNTKGLIETEEANVNTTVNFDIDKMHEMNVYFPGLNYGDVIKKFQQFSKPRDYKIFKSSYLL